MTLNTPYPKLTLTLALASSLFLTACSSSSSSNKDNAADASTNTSIILSGVVAKGILQGALVEACIAADCSDLSDPVATTQTAADGSYTLDVSNLGDTTLVIRVSHQDGAKMVCDVPTGCGNGVAFGQLAPMQSDLKIRSVTHVDKSAKTITGHVTPLTELVTVAAIESSAGKITPEAISHGSTAVKTLLGLADDIDLVHTKPVDITKADADVSDIKALQLSALSAAFADTSSGSIQDKIANIAKAVSGDSASVNDLQAITTSATKSLEKAAESNSALATQVNNVKNELAAAQEKATSGCENGTCAVEVPQSDSAAIARGTNAKAVKKLISDVRNLGWEVYPALRDDIESGNSNLISQAKEAGEMFNDDFNTALNGLGEVTGVVFYAYLKDNTKTSLNELANDYFIEENQNNWEYSALNDCLQGNWGNGEQWCYENYPELDINADAASYAAQFTGTINKQDNQWTVTDAFFGETNDSAKVTLNISFPTANLDTKVSSASASIQASTSYAGASLEINGLASVTLSKAISIKDIQNGDAYELNILSLEFSGDTKATAGDLTFTGDFAAKASTPSAQKAKNANNPDSFLPETASLNGKFSSTDGSSIEAKVSASFDNFNSYSYYANGSKIDAIPAKLELSNDKKTLAVSLGSGNNSLSYSLTFKPEHPSYCKSQDYDAGYGYKDAQGNWVPVTWNGDYYVDADNNRKEYWEVEYNQDNGYGYYAKGDWVPVTLVEGNYYADANGNKISNQNRQLVYQDAQGNWHAATIIPSYYRDTAGNHIDQSKINYDQNGMPYYTDEHGNQVSVEWIPDSYQDINGNFITDIFVGYQDAQNNWQKATWIQSYYVDANNNRKEPWEVSYNQDNELGYYAKGDWVPVILAEGGHYKDANGNKVPDGISLGYQCLEWGMQPALVFSQCQKKGVANCSWYTKYESEEHRTLTIWYDENTLNSNSSIIDALNLGYYGWWGVYEVNSLLHPTYGWVSFPQISALNESNFTNNVWQSAGIAEGDITEQADNFIKATVNVEVIGRISANSPEANIQLTAKRTEFNKANADLTISWKEQNQEKRTLVLSVKAVGNNGLDSDRSDLTFFVSDANGTQFVLSEVGIKNNEQGYITKDGTKYATITKENSNYFVTYHYDDEGKKANSKSEQFESLF